MWDRVGYGDSFVFATGLGGAVRVAGVVFLFRWRVWYLGFVVVGCVWLVVSRRAFLLGEFFKSFC